MAADFGISIAENLTETIGGEIIQKAFEMWNYQTELKDLKETVSTIQKVLLDADNKRDLSHEEGDYINKLKDALYDADDLFDEVRTLAELKQLKAPSKSGQLLAKVLCRLTRFFSLEIQLGQAYKMSRDVKDIKKKLDDIADRHTKFGFSVDYKPIVRRREETCSYVDAKEIIGREQDKEVVVDMLLDQTAAEDFSCVTIVGVGGLGKTTLAQLVYNDEKIQNEFELRAWACVSDQEGQQFDVKTIMCKILESVTNQRFDGSSTMQLVQNQLQERLRGKKYLIVLDDIWNEERKEWLDLKKFLMLGQGGSKIVVTTRSKRTGAIISDERNLYLLRGLSPEKSWHLFEMAAFKEGYIHENHHEFFKVGKKIVENCHNVPLALKVVGSLLFDQNISKWRSFEKSGLVNIGNGDNGILSILKLSYHNLLVSLKSCFSYCAVFPKGRRLEKEMLISLWMAQGYITPLDGGQSLEDAAEEHFVILLRRCFFQDVERDDYGYVESVKIHDLMHDVAQEVRREEIQVMTDSMMNNLGDKIHHVHYVGKSHLVRPHGGKIRTFICQKWIGNAMVIQVDKWRCLRVLVVSRTGLTGLVKLPDSIGNLLHLRYLDMCHNYRLKMLPNSITRLHNLQTLLLKGCSGIKELPKEFCKLVNLRHLDIDSLECMPSGMQKLTNLKVLSHFVSGRKKVSSEEEQIPDDEVSSEEEQISDDEVSSEEEQILDDDFKPLQALTGIRGKIKIEIGNYYSNRKVAESREAMGGGGGGGYLKGMEHLTKLGITFDETNEGGCDRDEAALEVLEPPSNIKELHIEYYKGTVIPKWGRAVDNWAMNMSNIAHIELWDCPYLREMPVLSKLPSLKKLLLSYLEKLEYMETSSDSRASESESEVVFFPSLVDLEIRDLEWLEGWWKGVEGAHGFNTTLLMFPCLEHLIINDCPYLTSFPPCPSVKRLELLDNNEALEIVVRAGDEEDDNNVVTAKLRELEIDNLSHLKSLPINCLTSLVIYGDEGMDNNLIEEFERCASSLQSLTFYRIKNARRLIGGSGLAHFTALETLQINTKIPVLEEEDEDGDGDNSCLFWKSIPQNLRKLELRMLIKETSLPKGMQYLTSLQTLQLSKCDELEGLPDWIDYLSSLQSLSIIECKSIKSIPASMQKLTSLQRLEIQYCDRELIHRCREPDGEDYHKIRHIPHIKLWPLDLQSLFLRTKAKSSLTPLARDLLRIES